MKRTRRITLLAVLTVIATAFIFWNSLKNSGASHRESDSLLALLRPILERIFGSEADLSYLLRKGAHLAEFSLLGLCTGSLALLLGRHWHGYVFFYVLAVAVADEYIQQFTGRASSVSDVLVDFTGALLGLAAAALIFFVISKRKKELPEREDISR